MKVLITGVCGFVGSSLARALIDSGEGWQVWGADNLMRAGAEGNRHTLRRLGVRFLHADLRMASDWETLPDVDWVIDAAANPSVLAGVDGRSSSRQLLEHNLGTTPQALEYCRRSHAGLILLSTSRVYSVEALAALPLDWGGPRVVVTASGAGFHPGGLREDFPTTAPVSLYGASKLASEVIALDFAAAFGFPVWINRCGVIAGAGQFGTAEQGIFSYWIHAYRGGRRLRYTGFDGAGKQVRDALHPRDLARLVRRQMAAGAAAGPRVLHAGGGLANSRSLAELTAWCRDRFPGKEPESDPRPRAYDVPWLVLDSSLASATLDWAPEVPIEAIFEEIAAHAAANPGWLDSCEV